MALNPGPLPLLWPWFGARNHPEPRSPTTLITAVPPLLSLVRDENAAAVLYQSSLLALEPSSLVNPGLRALFLPYGLASAALIIYPRGCAACELGDLVSLVTLEKCTPSVVCVCTCVCALIPGRGSEK